MAKPVDTDPLEAVRAFFREGQFEEYKKNNVVLQGDEEPRGLYYIEAGFVKVYSITDRGEEYIHIIYGPEDIFPVIWIDGHKHHNLYYEAISRTAVWSVSLDKLSHSLHNEIDVTYGLLQRVVKQFYTIVNRLDNLEYKFVSERVVYRLLALNSRFGVALPDGTYLIDIALSQQIIAGSINASRENVNREMEKLRIKGLISYDGHKIVILKPDMLRKELPGEVAFDS